LGAQTEKVKSLILCLVLVREEQFQVLENILEKNPNIKIWGIDTYGSVFKKYHETGIF
jgi:hypothetical protein